MNPRVLAGFRDVRIVPQVSARQKARPGVAAFLEALAPGVRELDLQKLMGFDRVDAEGIEALNAEEAVAITFNRRGEGKPV